MMRFYIFGGQCISQGVQSFIAQRFPYEKSSGCFSGISPIENFGKLLGQFPTGVTVEILDKCL